MDLIKASINRPVAVIAAVLMAVMFGVIALTAIPIQLIPDVRKPVIDISTNWAGAAPAEVEREIVNRQEDVLRGIEGLQKMTSRSRDGRGSVELEFAIGADMTRALLLVANRLDRIPDYPDEADEPRLSTSGSEDNPIAWFLLQQIKPDGTPMHLFGDFAKNVVRERLERVPGVSRVNVFGGSSRQLQIIVKPERLAAYGLTVPEVMTRLRRGNVALTAGDVDEGKRRYVVRAEGELNSVEAVRSVVLRGIAPDAGGPSRFGRVTVGDIADVRFAFAEPAAHIRQRGQSAIAIGVVRENGANVIKTMNGLRAAAAELRAGPLQAAGLKIRQVYDETVYIESAIDLVTQNIWVGGLLAAGVLLVFLRSFRATAIIAMAIPVSVIASFVAMAALGRTLNVISLAGIAFAVGMVVDAAIVVLENIYRLRQKGEPRWRAAYLGAQQVWGAVLVSSLTTVMVFIPILLMKLEAGQLFRDIAVAISVSVMLSLLVAVTVIPALSNRMLRADAVERRVRLPGVDWLAEKFVQVVVGYARITVGHRALGLMVVALVSGGSLFAAWWYLPKLEYLPDGNRNLISGVMIPPPGYNLETTTRIAESIEAAARPLWKKGVVEGDPTPAIENFFFVAVRGNSFIGASAKDPARAADLVKPLSAPIFAEPGTFGFMSQRSLFGRGIGGGRAIDLDVSGPELDDIIVVAKRAAAKIAAVLPREAGNQFRPRPGLEMGSPEVRLIPDRVRLADAGLDARQLAQTIDVFNDGARVSEVTVDGDRLDLMLMGPPERRGERTQDIGNLPVVTRTGKILPASALAKVALTAGPTEIRHNERLRTITLELRPAADVPLEVALQLIREKVVDALTAEGIPSGVRLSISGSADSLTKTWNAIQINLALALVIVYLVMAVLFESFLYPLVILFSVPVAAAGGVAGLKALNFYQAQSLDMLTLLGFVILIGIVVNNAILLVHQSLHHLREDGMSVADAILEATSNRIRPIFMSTLTSILGMLPLILFPGAGSELYRGLGSVVVGGLFFSSILTLLLIPPLMRVALSGCDARRARVQPSGPKV